MDYLLIFEKSLLFGVVAIGFAILFNVPERTLFPIYILAMLGGLTKFLLMKFGIGVVISSLAGSTIIGFLIIPAAHIRHSPPTILAIPAVIPMVPGAFAYKMILGLVQLTGPTDNVLAYHQILADTVNNGLKAMFILISLALGVVLPMLLIRKKTVKQLKLKRKANPEDIYDVQ